MGRRARIETGARLLRGEARRSRFGLLLVVLLAAASLSAARSNHVRAIAASGSVFVPVTQSRLADTRSAFGYVSTGPSEIEVAVTGRAGIPTGASAAVVTISVDQASTGGYLTAYPADAARPGTSSLNFRAGSTISSTQFVALSASGALRVFLYGSAVGVVVDVVGYFVPALGAPRAGRFVSTPQIRLTDTRKIGGAFAAGETRTFHVPSGLPVGASYSAVVANVTVTATTGPGYVAGFPSGTARPETASLTFDAAGETRGSLVVVPTSGNLDLFAYAGTHVVIDVVGYFTGASSSDDDAGLFVPAVPSRWVDTRASGERALSGGTVRSLPVPAALAGVGAAAAAVNVTMVGAAPGWVVLYPAGTAQPATASVTSSLVDPTIGNSAVVGLDPTSGIDATSYAATHLVIDLFGWFTSSSTTPPTSTSAGGGSTTTTLLPGSTSSTSLPPNLPPCVRTPLTDFNEWRTDPVVNAVPLDDSDAVFHSACLWAQLLAVNSGLSPALSFPCYDPFAGGMTIEHFTAGGAHSPLHWRLYQWGFCGGLTGVNSGEDLAIGTGSGPAAIALWKASPGHFDTVLRAEYRTAAIATACSQVTLTCVWIAQFSTATKAQLP